MENLHNLIYEGEFKEALKIIKKNQKNITPSLASELIISMGSDIFNGHDVFIYLIEKCGGKITERKRKEFIALIKHNQYNCVLRILSSQIDIFGDKIELSSIEKRRRPLVKEVLKKYKTLNDYTLEYELLPDEASYILQNCDQISPKEVSNLIKNAGGRVFKNSEWRMFNEDLGFCFPGLLKKTKKLLEML